MDKAKLVSTLEQLLNLPVESEVLEFKEAKSGYDFRKLGKYFSALSNEANLKNCEYAWLVFGVEDKTHRVVGSNFRPQRSNLDKLKSEIANCMEPRISFTEIHEVDHPDGRVVMFQIPAAPRGLPVSFKGHFYGRNNEDLVPLSLDELERIRKQANEIDWSAVIVNGATIDDLDEEAIEVARVNFKAKFPDKVNEVDNWNNTKFLDKAKVTIKGKITRTAIILLGKEESEHFISPAEAKIRWVLKDSRGEDKDYQIFCCPLLLAVDKVYAKIRNLRYRYIKDGSLFPDEVDKYEPYSIREALNNCIAHQDYELKGRINVIEKDDELIFTNLGGFIPGSVERVIKDDAPEEHYRNRFLANAMFSLRMVDTAGGGIRKMFNAQRERFFPMPDYDLSGKRVSVTLTGEILDMDYAKLLARNESLSLEEIMMLDKVQKKKPLSSEEVKYLKGKKLIEGRKPNFYISLKIAQKTGQKAAYTKIRGFEKKYYLDFIERGIKQHGSLTRREIDDLLFSKLPDLMSPKQKKTKVNNLLSELRRKNRIENIGTLSKSKWVIKGL